MNLTEAIQSVDMDEIIDGMNAYAIRQLQSVGKKDFNGKEPIDFVAEVLMKVMEGIRDWSKAKCSFREFLFGCLRSDIDSFFTTLKSNHTSNLPKINHDDNLIQVEETQKKISELLRNEGANNEEITLFEFWMDGIYKPAEIAERWGIDVTTIYNITKRLEKKLPKIQNQALTIV